MDGPLALFARERAKYYDRRAAETIAFGPPQFRLKLDKFVGLYFEYGHHGAIHVGGFIPDAGFLVVQSMATGEVFHVVPVMLEGRRTFSNEMEVIAWMAV